MKYNVMKIKSILGWIWGLGGTTPRPNLCVACRQPGDLLDLKGCLKGALGAGELKSNHCYFIAISCH